jgi:hypothetical protein
MKPLLLICMMTTLCVLLASTPPALADDYDADLQFQVVPGECMQFRSLPGSPSSPLYWDVMLSYAACIQDRSIHRIDQAEELETFVEQLHTALGPSLQYYAIAIEDGPTPIKLRAAYAIAVAQVALMTRARASLAAPQLRDRLEQLLEPHAQLAHLLFTAIYQEAAENPALAPDPVTRYVVRSSRTFAIELRKRWAIPREQGEPPLMLF